MRRVFAVSLLLAPLALTAVAQHGGMHGSFSPHSGGSFGGTHSSFTPHSSFGSGFSAPRGIASPPLSSWGHVAGPVSPFTHFTNRPPVAPTHSPMTPMARARYTPQYRASVRPGYYDHRAPYRRDRDHDRDYHRDYYRHWPSFYATSTYLVGGGLPLYPYLGYWDSDWSDDDFNAYTSNNTVAPYTDPYPEQNSYAPAEYAQPEVAYAQPTPTPAPAREPYRPDAPAAQYQPALPDRPAITLVFKDGRAPMQIRNYALTRTTLYVLDEHKRDIPLDQLDIAATEKTNHEAGNDFTLPTMP